MPKHIAVIQGHPDPQRGHFGHALAEAYAGGAIETGHEIKRINVAELEFPLLRTKDDFERGAPPKSIRQAQEAIRWADHLLIFYPLWHGMMPALLKAFFEQVFRPGFALEYGGRMPKKLLTGRTARTVVTMGMPAFIYRWYFGAHGSKSLKRSILAVAGVMPVKETLIGMVEGMSAEARWVARKDAGTGTRRRLSSHAVSMLMA